MRSFVFFVLASYAVRCDENYYVIEMPEEPTKVSDSRKPFNVYWNVPTMQCTSKKIPFSNLERFGIHQNTGDSFRGDKIAILYDPGLFPALLKNETSGKYKFRNGGVPQEGDMEKHVEAFKDILGTSVPDPDFNGVGIIDFESWRPVFRQNFGVLVPYKDVSIEIERKLHWWWPKNWQQAEAKRRFEEAARSFMQTTLSIAKQMRPKALWGYYGFPYCFNMANKNMVEACASNVNRENDGIYWMWLESTALYPSVYSSNELTTSQLGALIRGRVREAVRVRRNGTPVLPYFWFRYREGGYLSQEDLDMALKTFYKSGADGFIIWGSSKDVNTAEKCTQLRDYIETVMGPAIAKYATNDSRSENDVFYEEHNHDQNKTETNDDNRKKPNEPDPEYHWIPPENYTHNIEQHVKELIKNTRHNFSENEATPNAENNILWDIVLHLIMNEQQNLTEAFDNTTEYSTIKNNKRYITTVEYSTTENYEVRPEDTTPTINIVDDFITTSSDIGVSTVQSTEFLSTPLKSTTFGVSTVGYSTTEDYEKDTTPYDWITTNSDIGWSTIQSTETTAVESTTFGISTVDSSTIDVTPTDATTTTEEGITQTTEATTPTDITTPYIERASILDVNMTQYSQTHQNASKNEKKGRALHNSPKTEFTSTTAIPEYKLLHSEDTIDYTPTEGRKNEKKGVPRHTNEESSTSDAPTVQQVCCSTATENFPIVSLQILVVVYGLF